MQLHSFVVRTNMQGMTTRSPRQGTSGLDDEWRTLLARHATVSCALEKALHDSHGLGVSEFQTLDDLVSARCGGYKMAELTHVSYLSQSALSRAVARLERDGLVERSLCDDDRRAIIVKPTERGRALHEAARETHRAVLEATLVP
jgi:DNA-binding MarR family transcriptional regulator